MHQQVSLYCNLQCYIQFYGFGDFTKKDQFLKLAVFGLLLNGEMHVYDIEKLMSKSIDKHINKCLLNDRAKVQELIDKGTDQISKEINNAFK